LDLQNDVLMMFQVAGSAHGTDQSQRLNAWPVDPSIQKTLDWGILGRSQSMVFTRMSCPQLSWGLKAKLKQQLEV